MRMKAIALGIETTRNAAVSVVLVAFAVMGVSAAGQSNTSTLLITVQRSALESSEMQIAVDGRPAKVLSNCRSEDCPLDLAIVISGGNSRRMRNLRNLSLEKTLYQGVVKANIRPTRDRVMLIYAGGSVAASEWTDDIQTVMGAIENQPIPFAYEHPERAIEYGISHFSTDDKRRREIVFFADPFELFDLRGAEPRQAEIERNFRGCSEQAQKAGVVIFTVSVALHQPMVLSTAEVRDPNNSGRTILRDVAKATGGQFLDPDTAMMVKQTEDFLNGAISNQRLVTFEWPTKKDHGKLTISGSDGAKIVGPEIVWRAK
jgi:hypothetical protein